MRLALGLAVAALTAACAGTSPVPFRFPTAATVASPEPHLAGVRVAVRSVRDAREAPGREVGRHRDGLFRVTARTYVAEGRFEDSVASALTFTLQRAGAVVVEPAAAADVVFDVDVLALDVTTDAPLAGEETFGEVGLVLRVWAGGALAATVPVTERFSRDAVEDPGLVGDALFRGLTGAVARLRRAAPVAAR